MSIIFIKLEESIANVYNKIQELERLEVKLNDVLNTVEEYNKRKAEYEKTGKLSPEFEHLMRKEYNVKEGENLDFDMPYGQIKAKELRQQIEQQVKAQEQTKQRLNEFYTTYQLAHLKNESREMPTYKPPETAKQIGGDGKYYVKYMKYKKKYVGLKNRV